MVSNNRAPVTPGPALLSVMHAAVYCGDVNPSPGLWHAAPTAVFARYPFASSLDERRKGAHPRLQYVKTPERYDDSVPSAAPSPACGLRRESPLP